jgi:parvulin-like peptidyl-prolyl isomerase
LAQPLPKEICYQSLKNDERQKIMVKKEKRHTNHSRYFASGILLLLVFVLQGFLPFTAALSAAESLNEIPTKSRQQEQIKELRQQDQLQQLQRDQQLNNLQRQLPSKPIDNRDSQNQRKLDQLKNDQQLDRLQTELELNQIQREQNQSRQQEQVRELQRQQEMDFL